MGAGSGSGEGRGWWRWFVLAAVVLCATAGGLVVLVGRDETPVPGPTVGERLGALKAERSRLQARADGKARISLLAPLREASLLSDALAVRSEPDLERAFDRLPAARRQAFADVDALNAALEDALARPGEGARLAAVAAAGRAHAALEALGNGDGLPLVLLFTPRFVPPRRATGELTLSPRVAKTLPAETSVRLEGGVRSADPPGPTVPRYAPSFAADADDDPPVAVEVVGLHLGAPGPAPTLTIGKWRGEATRTPERLHFLVPRNVFPTEATRTNLVSGTLSIRRASRTMAFELPFVVLPDRPGSFALDQKVMGTVAESKTLVSPEILARAAVGETRNLKRCFDPPAGWRFDKANRRVLIVERLGWQDDIPDATLNGGTVEFAADEGPEQICLAVSARPATKAARTATIGRFEATLVRDRPQERVVQSGVRALDWREAVRVPIEPGIAAWKLYVRMFDEIDRAFEDDAAASLPFLRIASGADGKSMVLQADPTAEP